MKSVIGFHSFTECDVISAFAGTWKVKPLKLVRDIRYVEAFTQLRKQTGIKQTLVTSNQFICLPQVCMGNDSVDEIRY